MAEQQSSTQTSRLLSCGPTDRVRPDQWVHVRSRNHLLWGHEGPPPPPPLHQELSRRHFDGESEAIPREDKVFFVQEQREAKKPSHSVTTKTRNKSSRPGRGQRDNKTSRTAAQSAVLSEISSRDCLNMADRLVLPNVVNPGPCLHEAAVHAGEAQQDAEQANTRPGRHVYWKLFVQLPEGRREEAGRLLIKIVIRPFFPWIKWVVHYCRHGQTNSGDASVHVCRPARLWVRLSGEEGLIIDALFGYFLRALQITNCRHLLGAAARFPDSDPSFIRSGWICVPSAFTDGREHAEVQGGKRWQGYLVLDIWTSHSRSRH